MIETILGVNPNAIGAALIAMIVGLFTAYFRGAKSGVNSEKAKDAKSALDAKKVSDKNASLSDNEIKQRIKDKWQKL